MDFIIDAIVEWLKGLLVDGIMGNLDGLFDNVNQSVGEIATQVGTTPADWNAGVFSMIRQISETAILPIAGVILTFVMTYELIQMLIERNNLHEVDTWMFFKWVFKTFVAVMILTNTFNIVLAVFDVSQHVIQQSAGIIQNGTEITPDVLDSLRTELEAMELGPLFGLWLQSFLIQLTMIALNIVIFVIVYGRMIEIYLLTSLAPIPFATVPNRETGHMGQNYFRSLFAVGFQGLLILVCVAIYAVLIQSIAADGDPIGAIWGCVGYTVLLCFTLFKTGSLEYRQRYRTVVVEYTNRSGEHELHPMYEMSDGYRSVLSMVADIAHRMAVLNPQLGNAILETPGIIIIDEVELHLHPGWRKRILKDLTSVFPNIQFIVSTYSPEVITSYKEANLILLKHEGSATQIESAYGKDVNTVFRSILLVRDCPTEIEE